ncbi:protein kinase [Nonomuraea phyllanthi]|uniref:Protein kinase n=1 Tax=Nonomuraea phyllanthi TaxID=2219224 RepID=A0A5C4WNB5_9ACTN|nr:serine/threonine-protein kinase [Nonomuraea phyllanthi]KAB8195170.1 protein kinase [Nonomuraea phyllanthi]
MADMRPLRPDDPERIGSYRLVGVLGSGGQGVVYRGVGDDGRQVAVKVLHGHLVHDDDLSRRFLREAETARRVAPFCTAAVLDAGLAGDRPYIVSEYVPGDTLQALVRASGPRSGGALDRLAISTLTALAAIHEAGIVHRDFKPANVLMGPDGPVVIDFGIAKALDATTMTSAPVGTPAYMSPEQFRGERVGPASDVFGWAGTMVFAATGRAAFAGDTVAAVVNGVLSGAPDLSGVPPHLLDVIEACLSKDPADRPLPADLLRRLIRRSGPGAPPLPGPDPGATPGSDLRSGFGPSPGFGTGPGSGPGRGSGPGHGSGAVPGLGTGPGSDAGPSSGAGPGSGTGAGSGSSTVPDTPVRRRAVIGGAVAAAAALGVSAFTVLRARGDLADPSTRRTDRPAVQSPSPGGTATSPSPGGTSAGPSPGTASPDPTAPAEPFGTRLARSAPLPRAVGTPTTLAVTGATVACGTAKGAVYAWDLSSAAEQLGDGGDSVTWLAAGDVGGTRAVASGHRDGGMRLWSTAGESLASHKAGDPVIAVTITSTGTAVGVSQKYDLVRDLHSVVRLWDIATGERIGKAIDDHLQDVRGPAFGRLGADDVLVTGDGGNRVRVWRLSDGRLIHSFRTGEVGGIELMSCGEIDGDPVIVSTHLDATLRVYDPLSGKRRKKWRYSDQSPGDRGATSLVTGRLGDVPFAAVAHAPWNGVPVVRVWDLRDGEILGVLGGGDDGVISTLALAEQAGRPVLVGAGKARRIDVWSLGPA